MKKTKLKTKYDIVPEYSPDGTHVLVPRRSIPLNLTQWEELVEELSRVYSLGASDIEAAAYIENLYPTISFRKTMAELKAPREECHYSSSRTSPNAITLSYEERQEILDHFEQLKNKPLLKARENIVDSINNGDLDTSKWYMERKMRSEFATKQDTSITAIVTPALTIEEREKVLEKVFDEYKK